MSDRPPRAGSAAAAVWGTCFARATPPLMGAVPPPPVASPLGVGGGVPPCVEECAKLREEVQKRGLAAKPAGQLKARREEMCTYVGAYSAPELKMGQVHRSQCHELRHSG